MPWNRPLFQTKRKQQQTYPKQSILYTKKGKEPFWHVLWFHGQRGIFNDQRYYFVQIHPSSNNRVFRHFFFGGRGVSTLNKGLCVLVSLNCATNCQLLQWTVNHFSIKFTIYNKFYCNKGLCITYSDSEVIQSPKKQSPVKWWSNTICNQATEQQQSP